MTVARSNPVTLEEYLSDDDGTDTRYELIDGILNEAALICATLVMARTHAIATPKSCQDRKVAAIRDACDRRGLRAF